MGHAAEAALKMRKPGQSAIELLDLICEPYRGCDAEFEAEDPANPRCVNPHFTFYTDPAGPLGRLVAEAFAPARDWIGDWSAWALSSDFGEEGTGNVRDHWYAGPMAHFDQRYAFC